MLPTRFLHVSLASSLALLLVACSSGSDSEPVICTTESRPAIALSAIDSATRQPVIGYTATVVREDGYTETVTTTHSGHLLFAVEGVNQMDGIYDVKVTMAGYRDWHANDVVASRGDCGVNQVSLEAELVPL